MKKPKLILLNGNPGMGKSTLAQRYVDDHPMALNLDIDKLWHMMGKWQSNMPQSEIQKYRLASSVAKTHLLEGHSVIVPDLIQKVEYYLDFQVIAEDSGAKLHEVVLLSSVHDAIQRCKKRAINMGYVDGFRPGGVLDLGGREEMLAAMHSDMLAAVAARPNMVVINSIEHDIDGTYMRLLNAVE